ncbi:P-loop containing nucleoside triphosphate hydrolases superfamily protein [Klebsormidium nitens]|uniref:P-loop containing nucleoside triphosphate hydrolases superfamily protein n=1 Tax=Klebsormidium nitens TaxID=105231 RepID=A0A1Y1HW64_KLENI|nr:P-loop containing nucleoside triphosphate hydrolases superfamily protein [Klebsormidium nitens]|eukprot:GAQ80767.1 P-loop containing nucleoside triphosphate hydrolases superfamily protein [Klebsormidium nitens]
MARAAVCGASVQVIGPSTHFTTNRSTEQSLARYLPSPIFSPSKLRQSDRTTASLVKAQSGRQLKGLYKVDRLRSSTFAGESLPAIQRAHGGKKCKGCRTSAVTAAAAQSDTAEGFQAMTASPKRRYYMVGGKGGVGKTSCAAALAVKFANSGHPTLVVSTDPAHSLSDSFAQDVRGGTPVQVEGTDLPLYAMEIDPEQAREEFRGKAGQDGGKGVKDFMEGMGLGGWVEQLGELKLGELLDTPPPGLDEAVAISKVVQFIQAPEYQKFTRIIFDTAPTGHTLRLLSLPDFLDASIGKIIRLRQKLSSATAAIKAVFGQDDSAKGKNAVDKLEQLKERMLQVRGIFRDTEATEFVIVTIPTVMAISESARLRESLVKEGVPVKRLIVNQLLSKTPTDCKFCNIKRKDQARALDLIHTDADLKDLNIIEAPLFDLEIRGVPALQFMGDVVWR